MVDYFLEIFSGIPFLAFSPNLSFVLAATLAGLPLFLSMQSGKYQPSCRIGWDPWAKV